MIHELITADVTRGHLLRLHMPANDGNAVFELQVRRNDRAGYDLQTWRIRASSVRAVDIRDDEFDSVRHEHRHPLLLAHHHDEVELYFQGALADAYGAIGRLYAEHTSKVHGWISFDAFLNKSMPLPQLLAAPSGILARGPRPLLETYQTVLEEAGCRCSLVHGEPAEEGARDDLSVFIFGSSYVVASDFEAELLGKPGLSPLETGEGVP